jgi:hypothetical protein
MAAKKTAKKTTKKTPAKKAAAKKAPAKKAVAKKAPPKKAAAKKLARIIYTAEQVYSMIEQAAYFAAENDGFSKEPSEYWARAEASVKTMVKG